MATSVKFLSGDLNPIIICFYRCLSGLILILPFIMMNNFAALKSKNFKLQFSRSIINIASMICWFSAIGMMHLEKATALGFTTPLFTTILAVLILREVIRLHRITALIIGFLGVLIIIKPGYVPFEIGTLLMLIASFSFSFVLIIVKKLSSIDESQTIIFYQVGRATVLCWSPNLCSNCSILRLAKSPLVQQAFLGCLKIQAGQQ